MRESALSKLSCSPCSCVIARYRRHLRRARRVVNCQRRLRLVGGEGGGSGGGRGTQWKIYRSLLFALPVVFLLVVLLLRRDTVNYGRHASRETGCGFGRRQRHSSVSSRTTCSGCARSRRRKIADGGGTIAPNRRATSTAPTVSSESATRPRFSVRAGSSTNTTVCGGPARRPRRTFLSKPHR